MAFVQKVQVTPSDALTAMYPKKWSGKVVVRAAGKTYEHEVLSPRGDLDQPMTWEDVEEKAKRIGGRFFDPARIEKLASAVKDLEKMDRVDDLSKVLQRAS